MAQWQGTCLPSMQREFDSPRPLQAAQVSDRHKYAPIRFRPPEPDRLWLLEYAAKTGRPVNAVLAEALAEYRARRDGPDAG